MTRAELDAHLARLSPEAIARLPQDTRASLALGPPSHGKGRIAPPSSIGPEHSDTKATPLSPSPRSRFAPYDSKWELDYALILHFRTLAGEVLESEYHPAPLIAAGGTKYRPDFRVRLADGTEEYHEVKGHLRSRDAVRMRECAAVSTLPIVVLTKRRGAWVEVRRYQPGITAEDIECLEEQSLDYFNRYIAGDR